MKQANYREQGVRGKDFLAAGFRNIIHQEDGWTRVERRGKVSRGKVDGLNALGKKETINNGSRRRTSDFDKVMKEKAISFFFTRFPVSWGLREMFSRFGKVLDVMCMLQIR